MPDRTRLQRQLKTYQDWFGHLLAQPSCFTVIESYPIELLFPIRQGRSCKQVGKKGKDKGRWSVGIKLCWLLNDQGQVVDWDWSTMNTHDQHFHHLIEGLHPSIQGQLAWLVAMFNVLLSLFHQLHPDADPFHMSIAEFSLQTSTTG